MKMHVWRLMRLSQLRCGVCFFLFLASGSMVNGEVDRVSPRILVLNSYHYGLSWTDRLTAAVVHDLALVGADVSVEYMDTKRRPLGESEAYLLSYLVARHAGVRYDAIVVVDNDALGFMRRHRAQLAADTPIVFCGINYFTPEMLDDSGLFTGVMEVTDPGGTFELMQRLRPDLERVLVVADGTATGMAEARAVRSALGDRRDGVAIQYLENPSMDVVLRQVAGLDARRDAVLLTVLNRDADGLYFTYEESARQITEAAPCLVFGLWDFYLDTGVVGGRMVSASDQGQAAASLVKKILAGTPPGAIPIVEESPNRDMLDAPALLLHACKPQDVPDHVSILNATPAWVAMGREGFARDTQLPYEMFEGHGAIMMLVNPGDGQILDANDAAVRFYGYPRQQLLGMSVLDINTLTADEVRARMQEAARQGENRFRFQHRLASGEPRHVDVSSWPVEVRGVPVLFSIIQDVTDAVAADAEIKRLLEERTVALGRRTRTLFWTLAAFFVAQSGGVFLLVRALRRQKLLMRQIRADDERFELAIRGSNDGIWDWNIQTSSLYLSSRWKQQLGYAEDELENHFSTFEALLHPEDKPIVLQHFDDYLKGRIETYSLEFRMRHKDGSDRWILARGAAIRDAKGVPIRMAGSHSDITERKQAEASRGELLERLQALGRHLPGFIYQYQLRTDGTSCFPFSSEGIEHIYGVRPEHARDNAAAVFAVLDPTDLERVSETIAISAREMTPWRDSYRVNLPTGTIWVAGNATPQRLEDGSTLWHGYIHDITASKQSEEALQKNMDQLARMNALMMGRERRVLELKKEVNALCEKVGQMPPYKAVKGNE